jgi:hypothetical protein
MSAGNQAPGTYDQSSAFREDTHPEKLISEIITRNVGDRDILIPSSLLCILYSYQDIEMAKTPSEKNLKLTMNSIMILAMLHPVIEERPKSPKDLDELADLDASLSSCGIAGISVDIAEPSTGKPVANFKAKVSNYSINEHGRGHITPQNKGESDLNIEVPLAQMELGERMAVNNILERLNCDAVFNYFRIMKLAAKYGLLDYKFGIQISDQGISAEMVTEQERRYASNR